MNSVTRYASGIALVAMIGAVTTAHADDEARFGALRTKVAQLMAHEPNAVLDRIEKTAPHITACPSEEPMNSNIGVGVDGAEYLYTNIATSNDDQHYCFYMIKPFRRALSIDEGRDFSAALMMPDMPRFMPRFTSAAELARQVKAGEKHFIELRALVGSGTASPLDPDANVGDRTIGNLDDLVDCSSVPVAKLEDRSVYSEHHGANGPLYNDNYDWRSLERDGSICVYMILPFNRGLTVAEARDLVAALNLDLGMTDEFRQAMGLSDPATSGLSTPQPDNASNKPAKKKSPSTSPPSSVGAPGPEGLTRLTNRSYPYNTVAILNKPSS